MTEQDLYYMKEALLEGEKALAEGEVPIGAVMVRNGEIIARGITCAIRQKIPCAMRKSTLSTRQQAS